METLAVLICDDELGMRKGVSRALRDFNIQVPDVNGEVRFSVAEAESGEEALTMLAANRFDILLLDHKLPGMTGLDVLDNVAALKLDMLTIMITAYASIEAAVRATKQGAYDFLPKPFTPAEFKETLGKAAQHLIVARRARELAAERRRVRFEFISVVAHELKAPINAIEGYLNVLKSGARVNEEARTEIVDRCAVRIAAMRKVILDLLDMTRIESGEKVREVQELTVLDVARRAVETSLPEAESHGIGISLDGDETLRFRGDPQELEIIFNNLISNAVKYNRAGGKVEVQFKRAEDALQIKVRDTGIGMAPEDTARLFHDFVRIKNEKTRHILGSGLGLSIVRKLALLHGGAVEVKSVPDEGSTFTVTLHDVEETGITDSTPSMTENSL